MLRRAQDAAASRRVLREAAGCCGELQGAAEFIIPVSSL